MPSLDRFLRKNPLLRRFSTATNRLAYHAGRLFRERLNEKDFDHQDFVARILEVQKANPQILPDQAIIGYIMTLIIAGSAPTSIALRSVIYFLAKDIKVQKRLQQELDGAQLTYPAQWSCIRGLPYLDMVIREALRVHPPFSVMSERVVSSTGLTLPNGQWLKPGTVVSMGGWILSHDTNIYGEDADAFNPDRWSKGEVESEAEYEVRSNRMKQADFVFGHGPRSCLGKPVAQLELHKFVATLFSVFDVSC